MKKIIFAIGVIVPLTLAIILAVAPTFKNEESAQRFAFERAEGTPCGCYILTDNATGEQYLFNGHVIIELKPAPENFGHPYSKEAEYIAKTIYGEARGCSKTEQAAVVWCILNRVDSEDPFFPDDIVSVITQKNQFTGYDSDNPVKDEYFELALDVIDLWLMEDNVGIVAGRVLPKEYLWFRGDGKKNTFRDSYFIADANIWDWTLTSPY